MVETARRVTRAGFLQIVTLGGPSRDAVRRQVRRGGEGRTTRPIAELSGFEVVELDDASWFKDLCHPTNLLLKAVGSLSAVLGLAAVYDKVRVC